MHYFIGFFPSLVKIGISFIHFTATSESDSLIKNHPFSHNDGPSIAEKILRQISPAYILREAPSSEPEKRKFTDTRDRGLKHWYLHATLRCRKEEMQQT